MKTEFKIWSHDDRRTLAGILADNGYTVTIEHRQSDRPYKDLHPWVVVEPVTRTDREGQ